MKQINDVFSYEISDGLALVSFNVREDAVNTWTDAATRGIESTLDLLEEKIEEIKGVIFFSGKLGNFHAGANLKMIIEGEDDSGLKEMIESLHRNFKRLEELGIPTLAAINGHCLGGGYEFALAMTARMATDSPKTTIGLPECNVGLFPGGGGTQRMPRLMGYPAIEMILKGQAVPAEKAHELGMIDWVVKETDDLISRAKDYIAEIIKGNLHLKRVGHDFSNVDSVINSTRQAILKRTRGRGLPAHMLVLKAIQEGLKTSLEQGLKLEQKYFLEVIKAPESRGSINTFFLKTYTDKPQTMIPSGFQPRPLKKIAVLGFGTMGRGIVIEILRHIKIPVVVKDLPEALGPGEAFVRKILEGMDERGGLKESVDSLCDLIIPVSEWNDDFKDVDLVIEAVFEEPSLKAEVYKDLCNSVEENCLIASNTSSIPINKLSGDIKNPERFCGAHFFSPVWMMQLLEIVRGEKTSEDTINNLLSFCAAIRKRPVVCNDYPGFVVNAMLFPYFLKAFEILESGVPIEKIDEAMVKFGLPVGPIKLTDEVGIDVIYLIFTKSLEQKAPQTIENVVNAGRLGLKKSGKGFFLAGGGVDPEVLSLIPASDKKKDYSTEEIKEILFRPFVDVGKQLLEKKVVNDARFIDIGAIWGIGFPGDKGGPLKWSDLTGLSKKIYGFDFYSKFAAKQK